MASKREQEHAQAWAKSDESESMNPLENQNEFAEMMEFTEMKVIWDSQNGERLYAINESALYQQIKGKGKTIARLLRRFELVMIGVNILVGILLTGVAWLNGSAFYAYLLPMLYMGYALVAWLWRRGRRQQDVHFEPTMLGDLDKAIWRINYLIRRSHELMLWYLVPLTVAMAGYLLYEGSPFFALATVAVMALSGFATDRWEIKRCYLPQKAALESLRSTLLAAEA